MHLVLLRHTQTAVASTICYGNLDVDLAESANTDISRTLALVPPVNRVFSSPLGRCKKLAKTIAEKKEIAIVYDDRLIEMNFGSWQGRTWNDLPKRQLDEWTSDFLYAKPHGGESVAQFRSRIAEILRYLQGQVYDNEQIAIVSHGGVIRSMLALVQGTDERDLQVGYGECVRMDVERDNKFSFD